MAVTRIIAGSRKGHRLRTPAHSGTRPTTDRVREAAFSAIADWAGTGGVGAEQMLSGLSFLDLYAGSAAVALEAASRGAAPVVAVESQPQVAALARRNAEDVDLGVRVVPAAVEKWLDSAGEQAFDVVWADPPYALANERLAELAEKLFVSGRLAPNGLLVLERSSRDEPPVLPAAVTQSWQRRYGETILYFAMKDTQC